MRMRTPENLNDNGKKRPPMPVLVNAKTYALGAPAVIGILVLETKDDPVVLGINERGADRLIQSLHRFLAGEAERMLKPPKSD